MMDTADEKSEVLSGVMVANLKEYSVPMVRPLYSKGAVVL